MRTVFLRIKTLTSSREYCEKADGMSCSVREIYGIKRQFQFFSTRSFEWLMKSVAHSERYALGQFTRKKNVSFCLIQFPIFFAFACSDSVSNLQLKLDSWQLSWALYLEFSLSEILDSVLRLRCLVPDSANFHLN